jgi:hypothetical protein
MRKTLIFLGLATALVAVPAAAVGLDDLAKVVLGNKSVLKKAEAKCGAEAKLTASDNGTIDGAVAAVRRAISGEKFNAIDTVARANADTAAESATFCPETKKKKKGLLSKIGKAGKSILKGGLGL